MEAEDKELSQMAWVLKMDDATIESGLVHDFDASLSGIGQELGAGAYSMRLERKGDDTHTLDAYVCVCCCCCCTHRGGFSLFWDLGVIVGCRDKD